MLLLFIIDCLESVQVQYSFYQRGSIASYASAGITRTEMSVVGFDTNRKRVHVRLPISNQ